MAFIFGAPGLAKSPEELARQREVQQALTAKLLGHTPQNVGEGLSAIGQALAIRGMRSRNEKAAEKGRESAAAAFNPLLAALTGGGDFPAAPKEAPDYTPGAVTSAPLDAPDPASDRVANAFAAQDATGADWLKYANQGAVRNQPLDGKLIDALGFLPDLGVSMEVFSGGQPSEGPNRVGSHRHDNGGAADVFFYKDGRQLNWANPEDRPIFEQIVERAKANGVAGFGAGEGYMRPGSMHIGFGTPAVWGAGGKGANAPDWLRSAFSSPVQAQVAQNGPVDPSTIPASAGGNGGVIQPGQKQNLLPLLIKASQNPWLTESQRGIVGALLKNELAKNDPTNALDVEYKRAQIEKMKAEAAKANNPLAQNKFGLNPQYGVDENGNPVILQLGSNGVAVETKLPEDVQLSKAPIKLDAGTEWILLDPITRQPVGRVAKNLGEAEAAKAQGKVQGEARASLPGDILNVQQAIKSIDELSANPGLDSIVGSADQFRPSWLLGPQGNDALARLDQLKGKTFLQAYTTLKGGGQITEVEGQKAENAIARLNRAQDEKTFRQALSDLRDVIVKGQKTMLEKAGVPQDQWSRYLGTSVPAQPGPATINGYTIEEVQ